MRNKFKVGLLTLGLSVALIGCSTGDIKKKAEDTSHEIEQGVENIQDKANEEIADAKGEDIPTEGEDIYKPELLDVALDDLGVTKDDIVLKKVEYKKGKTYEVDFIYDGMEYEYDIDYSGKIVEKDTDDYDNVLKPTNVDFEIALNIALEDSGYETSDLREIKISLDSDHPSEIEVELEAEDGVEFEYKIDSSTGEILAVDR